MATGSGRCFRRSRTSHTKCQGPDHRFVLDRRVLPAAIIEIVQHEPIGTTGLSYQRYVRTSYLPDVRRVLGHACDPADRSTADGACSCVLNAAEYSQKIEPSVARERSSLWHVYRVTTMIKQKVQPKDILLQSTCSHEYPKYIGSHHVNSYITAYLLKLKYNKSRQV